MWEARGHTPSRDRGQGKLWMACMDKISCLLQHQQAAPPSLPNSLTQSTLSCQNHNPTIRPDRFVLRKVGVFIARHCCRRTMLCREPFTKTYVYSHLAQGKNKMKSTFSGPRAVLLMQPDVHLWSTSCVPDTVIRPWNQVARIRK